MLNSGAGPFEGQGRIGCCSAIREGKGVKPGLEEDAPACGGTVMIKVVVDDLRFVNPQMAAGV